MDSLPTRKVSYLEVLNVIGSTCSIIALIIVICPTFETKNPTAYYIVAFIATFCLLGWLFQAVWNSYRRISSKHNYSFLAHAFWGIIGLSLGLLLSFCVYMISFQLIKGFVEFVQDSVQSITWQSLRVSFQTQKFFKSQSTLTWKTLKNPNSLVSLDLRHTVLRQWTDTIVFPLINLHLPQYLIGDYLSLIVHIQRMTSPEGFISTYPHILTSGLSPLFL